MATRKRAAQMEKPKTKTVTLSRTWLWRGRHYGEAGKTMDVEVPEDFPFDDDSDEETDETPAARAAANVGASGVRTLSSLENEGGGPPIGGQPGVDTKPGSSGSGEDTPKGASVVDRAGHVAMTGPDGQPIAQGEGLGYTVDELAAMPRKDLERLAEANGVTVTNAKDAGKNPRPDDYVAALSSWRRAPGGAPPVRLD